MRKLRGLLTIPMLTHRIGTILCTGMAYQVLAVLNYTRRFGGRLPGFALGLESDDTLELADPGDRNPLLTTAAYLRGYASLAEALGLNSSSITSDQVQTHCALPFSTSILP